MRFILIFILLSILPKAGWAGESNSAELKMGIYIIPQSFWMQGDTDREGKRSLVDGVKVAEPSPFANQGRVLDVKQHLEGHGIPFPEGAEAYALEDGALLYIKNRQENFELIEGLFGGCMPYFALVMRHEVEVVQFSLPKNESPYRSASFAELKKAAGDSWKVVSALGIQSKTGQICFAGTGTEVEMEISKDKRRLIAPAIKSGESGASCAVESVIGPDSHTIDTTLSFRYRAPEGETPLEIVYDGTATLWDGHTQILQYYDKAEEGLIYALILKVDLALPNLVPLKRETLNE